MQFSQRSKYTNLLFYVVILHVFIRQVITTSASPDTTLSGCFQCLALMNREWNETLTKCSGTISDCGKCIHSYMNIYANDSKCTPTPDTIRIQENETAFVSNGSNIILSCQFSEIVDCAWSRRGFHLNIGGRYSYLSNSKGEQTTNCSIQIKEYNDIDNGDWDCKSMADSTQVALTSTAVKLSNDKVILIEGRYQTALMPIGGSVVLKCGFETLVDCTWSRDDHFIVIGGRYEYLTEQNGHQTYDCSIRISSFKELDVGTWECKSYGDSSQSAMLSASMTLSNVKEPAVKEIGENVTLSNGDKVNLTCTFDAEVECQWLHNGSEVNSSTLKFKENNSNIRKDCSIEISSVSEQDAGVWTCHWRGATNTTNSVWITVSSFRKPNHQNVKPRVSTTKLTQSEDATTPANTKADEKITEFNDNSTHIGHEETAVIILGVLVPTIILLLAALSFLIYYIKVHKKSIRQNQNSQEVQDQNKESAPLHGATPVNQ